MVLKSVDALSSDENGDKNAASSSKPDESKTTETKKKKEPMKKTTQVETIAEENCRTKGIQTEKKGCC